MGRCRTDPVVRFWSKVVKTNTCWLWVGGKNPDGYGIFRDVEKKISAHRWSWKHTYGSLPKGVQVLHRCDVRNCVRPDHLFLGTQSDNIKDMYQKRRRVGKLQEVTAHILERLAAGESQKDIAKEFDVNPASISKLVKRTKQ